MNTGGSVTHWIQDVKEGDAEAAQRLWERYFVRLVRRARVELGTANRGVSDEEDVAVSVFDKFFRASQAGRFPNLADRDSLWRLLVRMTAQKSVDHTRRKGRQRRGGGRVRGESALGKPDALQEENAIALIVGNEPTPEFCVMVAEQFQTLLSAIGDPQLQELALGKMEGYTNREMADRMACSLRTIERRLRLIRVKCKQPYCEEDSQ
jgi:DNA-directed RNA polymerase specialized sigma24 family protein